jgi:hypothetical protein
MAVAGCRVYRIRLIFACPSESDLSCKHLSGGCPVHGNGHYTVLDHPELLRSAWYHVRADALLQQQLRSQSPQWWNMNRQLTPHIS